MLAKSIYFILFFLKDNLIKEKQNYLNSNEIKLLNETSNEIKSKICHTFNSLATEHKLKNFLLDHGKLTEPIKKTVDNKIIGYYVPFKKKLEILLSIPENNSLDNHNNTILKSKNIKSNISDGEYIKKLVKEKEDSNNTNNSTNEKTILLFSFYYDDIEVVNAIGASRTKHKLGNLGAK
jgi:hypothetical protein